MSSLTSSEEKLRKKAAEELIQKYYRQLTHGCGNPLCSNPHCVSSGKIGVISNDEAAGKALLLLRSKASLCESSTLSSVEVMSKEPSLHSKIMETLNHEKLTSLIQSCQQNNNYIPLTKTIWTVFSNSSNLNSSWNKDSLKGVIDSASKELHNFSKEDIRSLTQNDKDVDDSIVEASSSSYTKRMEKAELNIDVSGLRLSLSSLFSLDSFPSFESTLVNAFVNLFSSLEADLMTKTISNTIIRNNILNSFVILMEIPDLATEEYLDNVLPLFCRCIRHLPALSQAKLAHFWSSLSPSRLRSLVEHFQLIISLRVYKEIYNSNHYLNDDPVITCAVIFLQILYYANIIGGVVDGIEYRDVFSYNNSMEYEEDTFIMIVDKSFSSNGRVNALSEALNVKPIDSRTPLIPVGEFYNEPLNEHIEMDKDFTLWKTGDGSEKFSFMNYPFILSTATKTQGLYYDNRVRMYNVERRTLFNPHLYSTPFLKLSVRRDHIVEDALVELETLQTEYPTNLRKQLVVEFDGEQGIDEGGISKEFFQLIIFQIFNIDYGMFIHCQETETFWFNPASFETEAQFSLVGLVIGLAIYNNVILDVKLPLVLYKKLLGKLGSFEDLKEFKPSLYHGLKRMVEYEGDDMEDVFVQPFQISYKNLFGSLVTEDLKENGSNIFLNQFNKEEFTKLSADFLLNKSIEKQFRAFQKGFNTVTKGCPLQSLFTPEELEILVCGEKEFKFEELENSAEYDGSYTKDSEVIINFWSIVHEMSLEEKKRLLQFTTGSDRIPVGGLSKLTLVIAKNGSDSERLPTAHTCYNVLLLPEYKTKERLKERLLKAIGYFEGFGLL